MPGPVRDGAGERGRRCRLELEVLDPEPFSDAEDKAVANGLQGRQLNAEGEMGYFGLAATNSTDDRQVIGFFSPDRENFVEYDITKMIHTLGNLTLLTSRLNSKVSNGPWLGETGKRHGLEAHDVFSTVSLLEKGSGCPGQC